MPLFNITWAEGQSRETKEAIRRDIMNDMSKLIGFDPNFIHVIYKDLPVSDMSQHGSFTEVYITEGRPPEFKDGIADLVKRAICTHTGWDGSSANVMIHDFRHGSIALGGKVVNRTTTAAEQVTKDKEGK